MNHPAPTRDYTSLKYIAALGFVEVAILYILLAVDTPLSPVVHKLLRNPFGVFTLVMCVVMLLIIGMIVLLTLRERQKSP